MTFYTHRIKFRGANGMEVPRTFSREVVEVGGTGSLMPAEVTLHNQLISAFQGVTDADITESWVVAKVTQEELNGDGDVFEQAALTVGTDNADPDAVGHLSIPAPAIGIFQAATGRLRDAVDVNDSALQTWLAVVANFELSDGENIETAEGVNGLLFGKRRLSNMKL